MSWTALRCAGRAVLGLALAGLAACETQEPEVACHDLAAGGDLGLLTLNILYDEVETRDARLERIADLVAGEDIHVVFLQEVAGGVFAGTGSVAGDLRAKLAERGLAYALRIGSYAGVTGLYEVANATLSRCAVVATEVTPLPRLAAPDWIDTLFGSSAALLMTRLEIPGFGQIRAYNTHLCAPCEVRTERARQVDAMLDVVDGDAAEGGPAVLGGDMNIDRFRADHPALYASIAGRGFVDLYALHADGDGETPAALCESRAEPDRHCTIGVSGMGRAPPMRLDYILARGFGRALTLADVEARVVFSRLGPAPNGPAVSDHSGVYVRLRLRPPADAAATPRLEPGAGLR